MKKLFSLNPFYKICYTRKYPLRTQLLGTDSGEVNKLKFWFEILSALPYSVAIWFAFWNSDHVVLKLSIRTSASPWRQQSDWGLRVIQNAYFSLMTHTKQLLFVTFCCTTAGIEVSFRTHGRTDGGRTDRRGSRNSYLDDGSQFLLFTYILTSK